MSTEIHKLTDTSFTISPEQKVRFEKYTKSQQYDQEIEFIPMTNDGKPTQLLLPATCMSDGICVSDYGHSIFCKLSDPADIESWEKLETKAVEFVPASVKDKFKSLMKSDGAFFVKLHQKNEKYKPKILPAVTPDKHEKSAIIQGSELMITGTAQIWVNYVSGTCGMCFHASKIIVDGFEEKRRGRKSLK